MYYNYKNSKILLNNSGILATDAQLNLQAEISPSYVSPDRHTLDYRAEGGIGGSFSLSYYLTGADPLKDYLVNETGIISGNFGGLYFRSGYLKTYSLNCAPNKSATVNAEIVFFDELKGKFEPSYESSQDLKALNLSNVSIIDPYQGAVGLLSNISNLNFSFSSEIQPLFIAGESTPTRIVFGKKETSASFDCDILSGDLPVTGKLAGVKINFTHPYLAGTPETFGVSGRLFQRNITTSVGEILKTTLTIKQHYLDDPPSISSISSLVASPGEVIRIEGDYLRGTQEVWFGPRPATAFKVINDRTIDVTVPYTVNDGRIRISAFAGNVESTSNFTPTFHPILISGVFPASGEISGVVRISGNNFYQITDVKFNSLQSGSFSVVSNNLIEAYIPEFAAWGSISVISTTRNQSGITNPFVPIPRIDKITPLTGLEGDTVTIQGLGFSGITGVLFNSLPNISPYTATFTVNTNTGITATVPTGNIKGKIKLLAQSGISVLSDDKFLPRVVITGLSPTGTRTGLAIEILGSNYYADLLYPHNASQSQFVVEFGKVSGIFVRVNNTRLTGFVPYGATSGPVYILDPEGDRYASSGDFKIKHYPPVFSSITPKTGFYSGYAHINGSELYDATGIHLTGSTGTLYVTAINVSEQGDSASFQIPRTTGGYYHVSVWTPEGNATLNSGLFIRDTPIIYSITPASGAVGNLISLSGRNIHTDSKIYFNETGIEALILTGSIPTGNDFVQFYVPVEAYTGYNNIILNNHYGYATGMSGVRLVDTPSVSGFNPLSGTFGDIISISGRNLSNVTGVFIGSGQVVAFSKINDTGISITIPENVTSDTIKVVSLAHDVYSSGVLDITVPRLTATFITPTGFAGDTITISGSRLNTVLEIRLSGNNTGIVISSGFTVINTGRLTFELPYGITGGPIVIKNELYEATTSNFEVLQTPTVFNIIHPSGRYLDYVSFSGQNLSGRFVCFRNLNSGNLIQGLNHEWINKTGIRCQVPREIITGYVVVTGERIWSTSDQIFYPIPQITGITPATRITGSNLVLWAINAGSLVNNALWISGEGTTGIANICDGLLTIDMTNISGQHINNFTTGYTEVVVKVGKNFAGSGALALVTAGFEDASGFAGLSSSNYPLYTAFSGSLDVQQLAPRIDNFTTTKGNNSISITLNGDSFLKTTGVYLKSGTTSHLCTVTSTGQSQLILNIPVSYPERSGQFQVFSLYGNGTSTNYFTVIDNLYISGIYPLQDKTGSWFKISGSGMRDVTGVFFDNYSADFQVITYSPIYLISGIVPFNNEGLPREYRVTVKSEVGSATFNPLFKIFPAETEFYGNVSGRNQIFATGIVVLTGISSTGLNPTFAADYITENGNVFLVQHCHVGSMSFRVFSYCWTGS